MGIRNIIYYLSFNGFNGVITMPVGIKEIKSEEMLHSLKSDKRVYITTDYGDDPHAKFILLRLDNDVHARMVMALYAERIEKYRSDSEIKAADIKELVTLSTNIDEERNEKKNSNSEPNVGNAR